GSLIGAPADWPRDRWLCALQCLCGVSRLLSGVEGLRGKENQPMPLRDHFRPPLDDLRHWEGFHATWPVMIVALLRRKLPRRYFAEPRVHSGSSAEIDVTTFENEGEGVRAASDGNDNGGGIATAVWAPPRPTLAVVTDL